MAYVKIRPRRGTASQWEYANPILSEGEMAFEVPETGVGTGLINIKQGDGQNSWNNLPYAFNGGVLNQRVTDLSETVASYDAAIASLTTKVNTMEISVKNIRKIEIQSSDPVEEDLILGEIWINTDMVTGSMYITDPNGVQITELTLPVGSTYNIKLVNTITSATMIDWTSSDNQVCEITNKSATGCVLNAHLSTDSVTITALAKANPETTLMNAKLRVSIVVNAGLEVIPETLKLIVGHGYNLSAVTTSSGTVFDTVSWQSVSNNYVEVLSFTDTSASIKAIRGGQSRIVAQAKINGFVVADDDCLVTVGGIGFAGDRYNVTASVGDTTNLQLVFTNLIYTEDYDGISWSSTDNTVIRVDRSDNQSASIGAYKAGSANILCRLMKFGEPIQEIRCQFNIKGRMSITPNTFDLEIGPGKSQTLRLNNELGQWDEITWESDNESALVVEGHDIDDDGPFAVIVARGTGSAVITATAWYRGQDVGSTTAFGSVVGRVYIQGPDGSECSALELMLDSSDARATLKCVAEALPVSGYDWWIEDPTIVRIVSGAQNIQCTVEGIAEGVTTLHLEALDGPGGSVLDNYTCEITVVPFSTGG